MAAEHPHFSGFRFCQAQIRCLIERNKPISKVDCPYVISNSVLHCILIQSTNSSLHPGDRCTEDFQNSLFNDAKCIPQSVVDLVLGLITSLDALNSHEGIILFLWKCSRHLWPLLNFSTISFCLIHVLASKTGHKRILTNIHTFPWLVHFWKLILCADLSVKGCARHWSRVTKDRGAKLSRTGCCLKKWYLV